jgi:hypothetical protein
VDTVKGSRFTNMKELRVQVGGDPWRILFAFDPQRSAILLVGGNKRGDKRWYKTFIPIADERFERHLINGPEWLGGTIMAIPFNDYLDKLSETERQAVAARTAQLVDEEATLRQLREARFRSQEEIARRLGINQASVSKLERRTDMYVSTLRSLIRAMGGELDIVARFPDRPPVRIAQFETLDVESRPKS